MRLTYPSITWGADPEGFLLTPEGDILGSEELIPEQGIIVPGAGDIARDGVQFELHPLPCPSIIKLVVAIGKLKEALLLRTSPQYNTVTFQQDVLISPNTLQRLSPEARILGCQPSENFYGLRPAVKDTANYLRRSGGGHIHLGFPKGSALKENPSRLVPLLDIFVANTCVLIDRNKRSAVRRRLYGLPGEYRIKPYGLEYRTLSNFWMNNSAYLSLISETTKLAMAVAEASLQGSDIEYDLAEHINIGDIVTAIRTNNPAIASNNLRALLQYLEDKRITTINSSFLLSKLHILLRGCKCFVPSGWDKNSYLACYSAIR